MKRCPYCNHEMAEDPHRFDLSPKQKELFDFILNNGSKGANKNVIMSELSATYRSYTTLRTRIHGINKKIAPLEIVARGGNYRLEGSEKTKRG